MSYQEWATARAMSILRQHDEDLGRGEMSREYLMNWLTDLADGYELMANVFRARLKNLERRHPKSGPAEKAREP